MKYHSMILSLALLALASVISCGAAVYQAAPLPSVPQPTIASSATQRTFTFVNNTQQTIWVGALNNPGHVLPEGGGWRLDAKKTKSIILPQDWAGRFWGRTGCTFNSSGSGTCATGDCGNRLLCNGAGGVPPATLAEFTLSGAGGNDFYDVSLVDGYNLPLMINTVGAQPHPHNPYLCGDAGCLSNLNTICPNQLQKKDTGGRVIACMSACEAFNTDQYCCRGSYGTPQTCNPSKWPVDYARIFKKACPFAYSYAYDDPTSTFMCKNCGYQIVFGSPISSVPRLT